MSEYLDPVDPGDRRFAAVVFRVALYLLVPCECVLGLFLLAYPALGAVPINKVTLLIPFFIVSALTTACAWMLVRINNGAKSTNGITTMPPEFICSICCIFLAMAMLGVIHWSLL